MRILAVDYGIARIGLALSDPTGMLAQGLSVLKRKSDETAANDIAQVIRDREAEKVVVGLPLNMNGTAGERALQCKAFAELLRTVSGVPVEMYDERLTTVSAERVLVSADVSRKRRKQVVDAVAATVLLQNYLDHQANAEARRATPREPLWD